MRVTCFEDLEVWKEACVLANQICDLSDKGCFSRDFALRNQMRRASISVVSNVAEGFERGGNKEFIQFLAQAKGLVGEVRAQLHLASDRRYLMASEFAELCGRAEKISRMICSLMAYLRQSDLRGSKYRVSEDFDQFTETVDALNPNLEL